MQVSAAAAARITCVTPLGLCSMPLKTNHVIFVYHHTDKLLPKYLPGLSLA